MARFLGITWGILIIVTLFATASIEADKSTFVISGKQVIDGWLASTQDKTL